MVFCIAKIFNLENVACVRKLSISQLANIIQNDTIEFLIGETWGYKINLVNKCGTASLGYFKNRAATGDLLQHYRGVFFFLNMSVYVCSVMRSYWYPPPLLP